MRAAAVGALAAATLLTGACGEAARSRSTRALPSPTDSASPAILPSVSPSPLPPPPSPPVPPPAPPAPAAPAADDPFELARRLEVGDPVVLAERLGTAEMAIRSASTPSSDLPELGRAQQAAFRQLVVHPAWLPVVLERVPPALRPIVQANVVAGRELRALTKPRTALPPWRIIPPPPAEELLAHYKQAEAEFGIPWQYLAAIHLVESRMGRIRGVSVAGAKGPMQFLPQTWARYGRGDINDPRDSILAAGRYLAAHGAPADMSGALFAYNRSQHYVQAITIYAEQMRGNERAYLGYYHWQVYYRTTGGDALLREGYGT